MRPIVPSAATLEAEVGEAEVGEEGERVVPQATDLADLLDAC